MSAPIEFYVSTAGVAGDPHKLLVAEVSGHRYTEMFNSGSLWSLKRARKKLLKRIALLSPVDWEVV